MRPVEKRLLAFCCLPLFVLLAGCGPRYALSNPCADSDGVFEGNLLLDGTEFIDGSGTVFALVGDQSMLSCRVITGYLSLQGDIPHLNDLDNLEEVVGIELLSLSLPTQTVLESASNERERECNVLGHFPSLKRIEEEIRNTGGSSLCIEYAGFEALEYVGRNFRCGPNPEVGRALKYVGWTASCSGEDRFLNLEYAGDLISGPATLPLLRNAGRIQIRNRDATVIDLSSLQTVGPIDFPALLIGTEPDLTIEGNSMADSVLLPSLQRVEGDIMIRGNRGAVTGQQTMSDSVRAELSDVTNAGRRWICGNAPGSGNDPCPVDDNCEEVFGPNSIRCCILETWPACQEMYPEEE